SAASSKPTVWLAAAGNPRHGRSSTTRAPSSAATAKSRIAASAPPPPPGVWDASLGRTPSSGAMADGRATGVPAARAPSLAASRPCRAAAGLSRFELESEVVARPRDRGLDPSAAPRQREVEAPVAQAQALDAHSLQPRRERRPVEADDAAHRDQLQPEDGLQE